MSGLTRLPAPLNSSGSQIFITITPNLRPNLTLRFLSGISSQISLNFRPPHKTISPISPPKFHKFTTSTIPAGRRKTHPHATAMDSNTASPPPDSDNTLVVEHCVHVDNASPEPHATAMDSNTASFPLESDNSPVVEDSVHVDNASPSRNLEYSSVEGVDQVRSEDVYANGEGVDQVRSEDVYANGEGVDQVRSEDVYANGEGVDQVRSEDVYANGEGEVEVEDLNQRKVLPEELSRGVMVLSCESTAEGGVCDVFVVGTAHVSQDSCIEVQAVISYLKPQVVFLELCSNRVAVLTPQSLKVPTMREMVEMLKKKQNAFGILYSWFLAKVATKLEVFPGSEFRVAFEEAKKYGGKVILGDRPVNITLRRTWGKMPLWHKTKLMYNLLFQALFLPSSEDLNRMLKEMDDSDMLTLVIQEMSKEFPTLMETLVHERDQYMSSTLLRVASEHSSVVAVVGKGHLQGIKKHWQQPVEMKDLMQMPPQKPAVSAAKVIASLGVAAAGVAIISGIYLSSKK